MTVPDRAAPSAEPMTPDTAARRAAFQYWRTRFNEPAPNATIDELLTAAYAADAGLAALVQRVRELEAAPTEYDEPPWRGWFSCEECGGWFTDNAGDTFENGSTVCHDCQSQRRLTAQVKTLRTALQSHHVEGLCPDCDAALTRTAWVD